MKAQSVMTQSTKSFPDNSKINTPAKISQVQLSILSVTSGPLGSLSCDAETTGKGRNPQMYLNTKSHIWFCIQKQTWGQCIFLNMGSDVTCFEITFWSRDCLQMFDL